LVPYICVYQVANDQFVTNTWSPKAVLNIENGSISQASWVGPAFNIEYRKDQSTNKWVLTWGTDIKTTEAKCMPSNLFTSAPVSMDCMDAGDDTCNLRIQERKQWFENLPSM
jgi:hypothetical protein